MTYLLGDQSCGGTWNIKCVGCGCSVAIMSRSEMLSFLKYITSRNELVYCFDCDQILADEVPLIFITEKGKKELAESVVLV